MVADTAGWHLCMYLHVHTCAYVSVLACAHVRMCGACTCCAVPQHSCLPAFLRACMHGSSTRRAMAP